MTINTLQLQAYKALRQQIVFCDLEPGKKISANSLADDLSIGRTPTREALIQLQQQELVHTIPQSGTYVSKIKLHSAKNARFVREHLERPIMIECCAKLTNKTSEILKTILAEQEKAAKKKDKRAFFHADNLFHEACFEIAEKEEVWQWLDAQNTQLERFRWLRVLTEDLRWETIMEQHYQLFHALTNQSIDELDFLVAHHLHLMLHEEHIVRAKFPEYFED